MKLCKRCLNERPLNEFGNRARAKDGLQPYCKPCKSAISREERARKAAGIKLKLGSKFTKHAPPKQKLPLVEYVELWKTSKGYKVCRACNVHKTVDHFVVRSDTKNSRTSFCKQCLAENAASSRKQNPERESKAQVRYYANNRKDQIKSAAKWTKDNRARVNTRMRDTGQGAAGSAKRRAAQLQQTPSWANHGAINAVYERCVDISRITGVPHEVDHGVPMQGKNVSGLHVEYNLQVIPTTDNRSKGNRHES